MGLARDSVLDRAARQVSRCVKCFSNEKVASTGLFRPLSKQPHVVITLYRCSVDSVTIAFP